MSSLTPRLLLILLSLPSLFACDVLSECATDEDYETNPACEDPERGHITGTITLPAAGADSASVRAATAADAPLVSRAKSALRETVRAAGGLGSVARDPFSLTKLSLAESDVNFAHGSRRAPTWRAGEVVVKGRIPIRGKNLDFAHAIETRLPDGFMVVIDLCNSETLCLARIHDDTGKPVDASDIPNLITRIETLDELAYAEPNLILRMTKTPNDDYYPFQWHYSAMKLPAAWDITTGSADIVGAVIDTGIILNHPDLASRVIGSADLIDDSGTANDGDGRDNNGDDPGDNSCGDGCHSHHGSHVAGTMGAVTNNASMVSGVTWDGGLLAVRVLGQGGGTLFDIAGGIYWAIGDEVDGVATNSQPADVLNLSLGGPGESQAMSDAVADAVAAGAIVLVAAGNENDDASGYTPANAPEAITVAAIGNTGGSQSRPSRAPYSNFGDVVDIAAPGGDQSVDLDQDGQADGVLSTVGSDVEFLQGTSMATPHVAGLAMLMKSLNPTITQTQAKIALQEASDPDIDCAQGCGTGTIDAARTLLGIEGLANEAFIVASPSVTRIGRGDDDAVITLENVGGASTTVELSVGGPDRDKITLSTLTGTIEAGGTLQVDVTIARTGEDTGEATVTVAASGRVVESQLQWNADVISVAKSVAVAAVSFVEDSDEIKVERIVVTTSVEEYFYKLFNLTPGDYLVIGLSDDDGDDELEDNEGIGVYPSIQEPVFLTVEAAVTLEGADFIVAPGFDVPEDEGNANGDVGAACASSDDCVSGLYCELAFPGGYCTADCSLGDELCPVGSECWVLGDAEYYVCLQSCSTGADCRETEGYVCDADSTCFPQ
jgi:serine protease